MFPLLQPVLFKKCDPNGDGLIDKGEFPLLAQLLLDDVRPAGLSGRSGVAARGRSGDKARGFSRFQSRSMTQASANVNVMIKAARKAARSLLRDFGEVENLQVSAKGPGDFVSRADIKAEQLIRDELTEARPNYGWLGEESVEVKGEDPTRRWIVDPLDGTTNFLHGLPHWAISIGLEHKGEMVAGVIYDPVKDEMFVAEKGAGAWLNDRRLRVSGRRDMIEMIFATGIPFGGRPELPGALREIAALTPQTAGIRRWGSAALDLAYVAAGRVDGYWERGLKPWDMAAGILLVREAGGFVGTIGEGGEHLRGPQRRGGERQRVRGAPEGAARRRRGAVRQLGEPTPGLPRLCGEWRGKPLKRRYFTWAESGWKAGWNCACRSFGFQDAFWRPQGSREDLGDAGRAGDELAGGAVEAEVGEAGAVGDGVERAGHLAAGADLGARRRGGALDAHAREALAQLGLVLHARGDLLADVAALAEVDAVQALEAHLQDVAVVGQQLDAGLRHAEGDAPRLHRRGRQRRDAGEEGGGVGDVGAPAEAGVARIGEGARRRGAEAERPRRGRSARSRPWRAAGRGRGAGRARRRGRP